MEKLRKVGYEYYRKLQKRAKALRDRGLLKIKLNVSAKKLAAAIESVGLAVGDLVSTENFCGQVAFGVIAKCNKKSFLVNWVYNGHDLAAKSWKELLKLSPRFPETLHAML